MYDALFKIVIIGNRDTGLSTLLKNYIKGFSTISNMFEISGIDFHRKDLSLDKYNCRLQIWRISSEPRFNFILPKYFRGAHGAIIVYDLTNLKSLQSVPEWIEFIIKNNGDIPIMLLGNKVDLTNS